VPAPVSSFIPTANALTDHDVHPGMEVPVAVWEVLSTIPDARSRQGSRHDLAPVIVIALAAVLAGQRILAAIAEWAADLPAWVRPRRREVPVEPGLPLRTHQGIGHNDGVGLRFHAEEVGLPDVLNRPDSTHNGQ